MLVIALAIRPYNRGCAHKIYVILLIICHLYRHVIYLVPTRLSFNPKVLSRSKFTTPHPCLNHFTQVDLFGRLKRATGHGFIISVTKSFILLFRAWISSLLVCFRSVSNSPIRSFYLCVHIHLNIYTVYCVSKGML